MRTTLTLLALLVGLLCGACGDVGSSLAPSPLPKPAGIR
jgi:hypothetical protein